MTNSDSGPLAETSGSMLAPVACLEQHRHCRPQPFPFASALRPPVCRARAKTPNGHGQKHHAPEICDGKSHAMLDGRRGLSCCLAVGQSLAHKPQPHTMIGPRAYPRPFLWRSAPFGQCPWCLASAFPATVNLAKDCEDFLFVVFVFRLFCFP